MGKKYKIIFEIKVHELESFFSDNMIFMKSMKSKRFPIIVCCDIRKHWLYPRHSFSWALKCLIKFSYVAESQWIKQRRGFSFVGMSYISQLQNVFCQLLHISIWSQTLRHILQHNFTKGLSVNKLGKPLKLDGKIQKHKLAHFCRTTR